MDESAGTWKDGRVDIDNRDEQMDRDSKGSVERRWKNWTVKDKQSGWTDRLKERWKGCVGGYRETRADGQKQKWTEALV